MLMESFNKGGERMTEYRAPDGSGALGKHGRVTERERFLQAMDDIIPWGEWVTYIRPQYPPAWRDAMPYDIEQLLRAYLLRSWFNTSDELTLDCIADSRAMRAFVGGRLEELPDVEAMAAFRRFVESSGVSEKLFRAINRALFKGGAVLRCGSIADAVIIRMPG